jgi:hypothetical protein
MKKLALTAVGLLASLNLFAQGVVSFQNSSTTLVTFGTELGNSGKTPGAAVASADGIRVALYWAPDSAPNSYVQIGAVATVGVPLAGRYSGGNRTTGNETAPASAAWFQVKAFELAYGGTYEAAIAAPASGGRVAFRGESNKFHCSTGNPPLLPATNLSTAGLEGFTVNVPEPSVIALGLLGAGALLLMRRRK